MQIIQDLPRIFSDGILLQSDQKQEGSADRATYHHYGTKVQLDGREIFVRIVVREENGNLFYDSHVSEGSEIERSWSNPIPAPNSPETITTRPSKDRLAQHIWDVKRGIADGNTLPQDSDNPKAAVSFSPEDGRALIQIFETGDITSLVHELGHVFRRDLNPADLNVVAKLGGLRNGAGRTISDALRTTLVIQNIEDLPLILTKLKEAGY